MMMKPTIILVLMVLVKAMEVTQVNINLRNIGM